MNPFLSRIRYPKFLLLLLLSYIFAYLLIYGTSFKPITGFILSLGYLGYFILGLFYAYGFTAAPSAAILLLIAKQGNLIQAVFISGIGALTGNLLMFLFIRYSFSDEIELISKEKLIKFILKLEKKIFGRFQKYLLTCFAGFLIASPLPTEIGVSLLASSKKISIKRFMLFAYLLHSIGIFIILIIGSRIL
jgi:uncharacterized membrane protein YdjX (TVP38/TMEM64 family)